MGSAASSSSSAAANHNVHASGASRSSRRSSSGSGRRRQNRNTGRRNNGGSSDNSGGSAPAAAAAAAAPSAPPALTPNRPEGGDDPVGTRAAHLTLNRPYTLNDRSDTMNTQSGGGDPIANNPAAVPSVRGGSASNSALGDDGSSRPPGPDVLSSGNPSFDSRSVPPSVEDPALSSSSSSSFPSSPTVSKTTVPPAVVVGPRVPAHSSAVVASSSAPAPPVVRCLNPASEINARLDTQVEVRVYPCNNNHQGGISKKKKFTQFTVKPEGVIIQGTNRCNRTADNDLGAEYTQHIGRKLQRHELTDNRACQLLVTAHRKSFWVVPAPDEAFSRHSGTCRLLGDRKHQSAAHAVRVGDFLRVGSVGVVVVETHDGVENRVLREEKIQKIMKDTASSSSNGGFLDLGETDGENSDDSMSQDGIARKTPNSGDSPVCYMCFDEEDTEGNPLITPCKCLGDTRYVHVECLRKWHTAEADNRICFLSSVDATCSVCKSTFRSDFKLQDGRLVKLFKSSLEPPYVSLLVATKHEMAQRLFNTRFQLSFHTLLKPDGRNGTRPLFLGRSSGADMVLDYRTVSARHASIRFKNGEFIFADAGSSNGSYLYLRRPVELTPSQSVQFRLGRSMISMKVVNKWNRRLLRAVRRSGHSGSSGNTVGTEGDDHSVGSNDDDVRITDGRTGNITRSVPCRTREGIMQSLPPPGRLSQSSHQHLDLLYALAYPKRIPDKDGITVKKKDSLLRQRAIVADESKAAEIDAMGSTEEVPSLGETVNPYGDEARKLPDDQVETCESRDGVKEEGSPAAVPPDMQRQDSENGAVPAGEGA